MDGAVVRGAVDVDTTNVEVVGGAKEELVAGSGGKASPHCSGRGSTGGYGFLGAEGSQDVTVVGGNGVVVVEDRGTGVKGVKEKPNSLGLAPFAVVGRADKVEVVVVDGAVADVVVDTGV